MIEIEFGEIVNVPMNQIWQHEERHFTPWLAQNIEKLGDALGGLQLQVEQTEIYAGSFQLDILAKEVSTNKVVVIENQIYKTDHKHLGQLITYASFFKAEIIIWVSQEITEEHRSAMDWLNNNTSDDLEFYAVEANIIKIGNSQPALNFKLKSFPNEWSKSKPNITSPTSTETGDLYRVFFQKLLDELRETHRFTNARTGQPQSWYSFTSGTKGCTFGCSFARGSKVRAEVYIDTPSQEANKEIFRSFESQKAELEYEFGEELIFEELPTKRASRIAVYREGDIYTDTQTLEDIRAWCIEKLLKFKSVFVNKLDKEIQKNIQG
ncbi:DUF4268 domain-containing protein [Pedobacter sp. LMG 31464]|uniref:DUF4268 domain-containing protein n=1 Tax=Pedobacter planticolens TaxID=2679964 RepID=A0A923DWV9_9SPHI|nr:DUF4268 domain-containing protein [Pedobacter planticolens]MBB2145491.1 DUF4268 domain-containing protein [Pedobacter planticolens]